MNTPSTSRPLPMTTPASAAAGTARFGRLLGLSTLAVAVIAALAGCASSPPANPSLDRARSQLQQAQARPDVARLAAPELARAAATLDRAERARTDGDSSTVVEHLAYLGRQQVVIAEQTGTSRAAQAVTASAATERDRMRLALRNAELAAAEQRLGSAQRQNDRQGAELANAAQANERQSTALALAAQSSERQAAELARTEAAAAAAVAAERTRLAARDARVNELEMQLQAMDARRSERGIVVTLGDLLFATGQAELKPEGLRSVVKLSDFLKRNPERTAAIEGYTDDVGSQATNQQLSDRRARAVQEALLQMGVAPERLRTLGYGESRPVADNATAGGRQQNRRVEVVFAAQAGDVLMK